MLGGESSGAWSGCAGVYIVAENDRTVYVVTVSCANKLCRSQEQVRKIVKSFAEINTDQLKQLGNVWHILPHVLVVQVTVHREKF